MIITEDEGAGALELLHACLNLVPEEAWIEPPAGKMSKTDAMDIGGKTIICYEADSAKDLLMQVLTDWKVTWKISPS